MRGLNNYDPILGDIKRAAKAGHFDRRDAGDPSELERTPILELLVKVGIMSPERRRRYLLQIGRMPDERLSLSGSGRRSKKTNLWLSK